MPPLFVRILIGDWHKFLSAPWAHIILVLIAVVCGGIVGGERERREKPAGLRTLMLVCLGSTLFTMAGYAFTSSTGDSGRVAAQIVTGIGFLGAGVILHGRGTISGTTTAAMIWVMAAVGMLTATGYACGALAVSILIRLLMFAVRKFEVYRIEGFPTMGVDIDFTPDGGKTRVRIERVLADYGGGALVANWTATPGVQRHQVALKLRLPQHHLHELLGDLAEIPQVLGIQQSGQGETKRSS